MLQAHCQRRSLVSYLIRLQLEIALSTVWIFSITAVKVSILDLYIKIFRVRWFVKICWCFIAFLLVFLRLRPFRNLSHLPTNVPELGPDWRRYLCKSIQCVSTTTYNHTYHRRFNCGPSDSCSLEFADADVEKNKHFPSIWSWCHVSPTLSKTGYIESI